MIQHSPFLRRQGDSPMRSTLVRIAFVLAVLLGLPAWAAGQAPYAPPPDNPYPYDPGEPVARRMSLAKAAGYLDGVARFWMQKNSCGACHANFTYLMARPLLQG